MLLLLLLLLRESETVLSPVGDVSFPPRAGNEYAFHEGGEFPSGASLVASAKGCTKIKTAN